MAHIQGRKQIKLATCNAFIWCSYLKNTIETERKRQKEERKTEKDIKGKEESERRRNR